MKRRLLAGGLLSAAFLIPHSAEASFGSARGAVTSFPKLTNEINLDKFESLDPRKQKQVQSVQQPDQINSLYCSLHCGFLLTFEFVLCDIRLYRDLVHA